MLSQRLVRRSCDDCGGSGCEACGGAGEHGRRVISEFLPVTQDVAGRIAEGAPIAQVMEAARRAGFRTMREDADQLLSAGKVTRLAVERTLGQEL